MLNLISTEIALVLTFLCKKMPNLFKYIIQYSTPREKNSTSAPYPYVLSTQQIQAATLHPNTVIMHALSTILTIQIALNTANDKAKEIAEQRAILEKAIASLPSAQQE